MYIGMYVGMYVGRCCPAKTLANHKKYLLLIVFGAARHNTVLFCLLFEPPDLVVNHKLASQIKSEVSDIHPRQVSTHFEPLNSKASLNGRL